MGWRLLKSVGKLITLHSYDNYRKYILGKITKEEFAQSKSGITVEPICNNCWHIWPRPEIKNCPTCNGEIGE